MRQLGAVAGAHRARGGSSEQHWNKTPLQFKPIPLPPPHAGLPPAPTNLQFATASLDSVTVSWDASPTAARYEVKLLQTAPTEKVASVAVVEDDGSASFTKTFNNLTPGRYSVSIDRESLGGGWMDLWTGDW